MSTLNVQIPASLYNHLKEIADQEGVSVHQFITLAISEKISSLKTVDYLKERAAKGDRNTFEAILEKVPDIDPEEYDKL